MTPRESRPEREGEESLAETLARMRPAFEGIRKAYGIGFEDGQDVLQETLLRFTRRRDSVGCREAWLRKVYRNECLRLLARRGREVEALRALEAADATATRPRSASREVLEHEVLAALDGMLDRARALLRGGYLEGVVKADLSTSLGVSRGSLKTLLARSRAALRRLLGRR